MMHATRLTQPRLRPLYTIWGVANSHEQLLDHLDGYRNSLPVRLGNAASTQEQFDVFGEVVHAFHTLIQYQRRTADGDERRLLAGIADHVCRIWREPDAGIWEARAPKRHYTHSKAMMWDALDSAVRLADEGQIRGDVARWRSERDAIRDCVINEGYSSAIGAFTQAVGSANLDASLLVLPMLGIIDGADPRMQSTIDAIRARLEDNGFLRRYEGLDDGFAGAEGAFTTCNFWLVAALAHAGRIDEAKEVYERTLRAANDVGLMSEQFDPRTREALGNTPQGLSHIELIDAALAIARAERGELTPHNTAPRPQPSP
jgi:GH15 family glucan-1,4-alpha-glucosidase